MDSIRGIGQPHGLRSVIPLFSNASDVAIQRKLGSVRPPVRTTGAAFTKAFCG